MKPTGRKQLLRLLLLAPLFLAGMVLFGFVDANLQHWFGREWLPAAVTGFACAILLVPLARHIAARPRRSKAVPNAGPCVYCGYDLRADRRSPNYCPQCGSSQSQEAHLRRRSELMLELERLQMELVRNHQHRLAGSNRIQPPRRFRRSGGLAMR